MRFRVQLVTPLMIAAVLAAPVAFGGCRAAVVYDPFYSDSHRWDHDEDVRYRQWEVETHREHAEFARRAAAEQHEYWDWRHKHP